MNIKIEFNLMPGDFRSRRFGNVERITFFDDGFDIVFKKWQNGGGGGKETFEYVRHFKTKISVIDLL